MGLVYVGVALMSIGLIISILGIDFLRAQLALGYRPRTNLVAYWDIMLGVNLAITGVLFGVGQVPLLVLSILFLIPTGFQRFRETIQQIKLKQEIEATKALLEQRGSSWELLNNLGHYYRETGELDKALEMLDEAVQINPDKALVHINLGNTYFDLGMLVLALKEYQTAKILEPQNTGIDENIHDTMDKLQELRTLKSKQSWDFFISYRSLNANVARQLAELLMAGGFRVWFAEYYVLLPKWAQFKKAYHEGAQNCTHGIFLTTPEYPNSKDCKKEVLLIKNRLAKQPTHIIEVCLENNDARSKLGFFPESPLVQMDFAGGSSRDYQHYQSLLSELSKLTGLPTNHCTIPGYTTTDTRFLAQCAPISFALSCFELEKREFHPVDSTDIGRFNCPQSAVPFEFNVYFDKNLYATPSTHYDLKLAPRKEGESIYTFTQQLGDQRRHFSKWFMKQIKKIVQMKEDGLHTVWIDNKPHLALTHHFRDLWMRKYSVILIDLPKPTEVIFTFAVKGTFQDFCQRTWFMEDVVSSTRIEKRVPIGHSMNTN